ncbi:MAG: type II toxin-antitoxin system Phd/YefM family antitoxin [Propionibacteriaceae bacterium]|nr:type II toxin-antitoxin system Phd/YefM family antitoxin [Propionibacteriaceae bacterium]
MTVIDIGVRELQRELSRVVREVEDDGATYRITLQGRPTTVVLGRTPTHRGASLTAVRGSALYEPKPPGVAATQLAELVRSRDRAGRVGEPA